MTTLSRTSPAAPVRLLHLGLGNFFRAHQAWYTDQAADATSWGYAAFGGRSSGLSDALRRQDGLYTLVVRGAESDALQVVTSVVAAHSADAHDEWLGYWRDPRVAIVTLTITEAGYRFVADGPQAGEVARLRADPEARVPSAVGRLVAGLAARRSAGAGSVVLLPCDNLPDNGDVLAGVLLSVAEVVDPALPTWIAEHVTFGSTMVDRITPATTPVLGTEVAALTGVRDAAPVATEPFTEWVIACDFPAGRPDWDATFVEDVRPYERRKLWLLNGSHSLLAYLGLVRGHATVADAMSDPYCRAWVDRWWDEAQRHLELDAAAVRTYRAALVERFSNTRIRHELGQISGDGSEKLRARILPAVRAERAAGRVPAAACHVLGAWVAFVRRQPFPVRDPHADVLVRLAGTDHLTEAVRLLLGVLEPSMARDEPLVAAVTAAAEAVVEHAPAPVVR